MGVLIKIILEKGGLFLFSGEVLHKKIFRMGLA